jgi:two-component system phosphate regulon response regulator PhoB
LKREGSEVIAVEDGEAALKLLSGTFQLVVLDWMLPGISGLEICKRIRASGVTVPVLMVTARADSTDVILGLEGGADDYITKPFEIPVLVARVRALARRAAILSSGKESVLSAGGLSIDTESHIVSCAGQELQITPSEFKLLSALLQNRGRVLSRERLIDLVQGEGVSVVDRTVDTHVFGLRKKLGPCSDVIETIRGVGYRVRAD